MKLLSKIIFQGLKMQKSNYRTLFTGVLVQESSLSAGGRQEDPAESGSIICRDGTGLPTLRGTTFAGAMLDNARKLGFEIPRYIASHPSDMDKSTPLADSLWRVFNSHPTQDYVEHRIGVGIRQDTGAGAEGRLFEVETLPIGTQWNLLLEIKNTDSEEGHFAEKLAAAVLLEWQKGRCWIGRNVARGMGWMRLTELKCLRLTTDHALLWPDSESKPEDKIEELLQEHNIEILESEAIARKYQSERTNNSWTYVEINGTLKAGQSQDGYGLDAVSIGAHSDIIGAIKTTNNFLFPQGEKEEEYKKDFDIDKPIAMTAYPDDSIKPFIPGSGLRGPLRHALSRWLRSNEKRVYDPNDSEIKLDENEETDDEMISLFGKLGKGSRILVRDAYLKEPYEWKGAFVHGHAEDEFAQSTYKTNKFTKLLLVQAKFEWKMLIEIPPDENGDQIADKLRYFKALAESGHLPVGSGKWQGLGWPTWEISSIVKARAGEDGETWQL